MQMHGFDKGQRLFYIGPSMMREHNQSSPPVRPCTSHTHKPSPSRPLHGHETGKPDRKTNETQDHRPNCQDAGITCWWKEDGERRKKRSVNLYKIEGEMDLSMAPNNCRLHQQLVFKWIYRGRSDMPCQFGHQGAKNY